MIRVTKSGRPKDTLDALDSLNARAHQSLLDTLNSNDLVSGIFERVRNRVIEESTKRLPFSAEALAGFYMGNMVGGYIAKRLDATDQHGTDQRDTIFQSLAYLVILAKAGCVTRVRRCEACRQWFFAMRQDAKTCSAACRHKLYRQTPGFKKNHRLYARWKYQHESGLTQLSFHRWAKKEEGKHATQKTKS